MPGCAGIQVFVLFAIGVVNKEGKVACAVHCVVNVEFLVQAGGYFLKLIGHLAGNSQQ